VDFGKKVASGKNINQFSNTALSQRTLKITIRNVNGASTSPIIQ
jgi:hypothetical protein